MPAWRMLPPMALFPGLACNCSIQHSEISAESGLVDGRMIRRFNCFYDTSAEAKVAKDLFIQSVNSHARESADEQAG
jgi:hypothetical protein